MYTKIPAISGNLLIELLKGDGWEEGRRTKHGISMTKFITDRTRVTIIPTVNSPLPDGTLSAILGPKQTGIGKSGLRRILNS